MKIVLLVTVCNQNKERIRNQVNNLKWSLIPEGVEMTPVFVFGKGGDTSDIPFETLVVDSEEKYTHLYMKMFKAYKAIHEKYDYDFICKIDDDTKITTECLKPEWLKGKDYIGRMFSGNSQFSVTFDFDWYEIHKKMDLVPPFYEGVDFQFATGDCYFLSKKAVQHILDSEKVLYSHEGLLSFDGICSAEDRLFGYILHGKDVVLNDIKLIDPVIEENRLQVTEDYFSMHPIHNTLFSSLIGVKIKEQFEIVCKNQTINLLRRRAYIQELENKVKGAINDFLNSKRSIGLG